MEIIKAATKIIIQHIEKQQKINVTILATALGISTSQLYRKIKADSQKAPVELIRKIRLEKGRHLLLNTNYPIDTITALIGFSDSTYFIRCFKNRYGKTPKQYRKQHT